MRTLYGRHPVDALLEVRPRDVRRLWVADASSPTARLARDVGVSVEVVGKDRLEQLAKSSQHQGLVAEAEEFRYADLEDVLQAPGPALVLVLDSVQDPHNLGALVRSAECFGATGVVVPQDRAALVTGAASKASAGAIERVPVAKVVNLARALDQLKQHGVWVTGLAGEGEQPLDEIDLIGPTALVIGAEGTGLRPLVRKHCDHVASIPMSGRTGSLNASVAGGVALWTAFAQRGRRPGASQSA